MEFYISDEKVPVLTGSLDIEKTIENRSTASFTVKDLHNEFQFKKGMQVRIEDGGDLVFRGFVEISKKKAVTNTGQFFHLVDCVDMHYLADKRIVALAQTDTTASTVVETIVSRYLMEEGLKGVLRYWYDYENQTWDEVRQNEF